MKTSMKIGLIAIALAVILILVGGIGGGFKDGLPVNSNLNAEAKSEAFGANTLTRADINVVNSAIEFVKGDELKVDYYVSDASDITVSFDNGVLTVKEEMKNSFNVHFGWNFSQFVVKVTVPNEGFEVDINSTNGAFTANDFDFLDVSFDCVNGAAVMENCTAREVRATTTNGAFTAKNSTFSSLEIEQTNGSVYLEAVTVPKASASSTNGAIYATKLVSDDVDFDTVNGRITCEIDGKKNEYSFTVVRTGEIKSSQTVIGSSKSVYVETTNGSTRLTFTQD